MVSNASIKILDTTGERRFDVNLGCKNLKTTKKNSCGKKQANLYLFINNSNRTVGITAGLRLFVCSEASWDRYYLRPTSGSGSYYSSGWFSFRQPQLHQCATRDPLGSSGANRHAGRAFAGANVRRTFFD